MRRHDGRGALDLRPTRIEIGAVPYAEGSCLIAMGATRVLCAASVLDEVPEWRVGSGQGWVTAEYGLLPRSTHTRTTRERGGPRGRTQEIQRLIGRSLRSVVDLAALGPRTVVLDCDVLQADGGTRTASVTGAAVALALAFRQMVEGGVLARSPMQGLVAGVSAGVVEGSVLLDLDYSEDSRAQVDFNLIATDSGDLVEVQGTAERAPFGVELLSEIVAAAREGTVALIRLQKEVLGEGDAG